MELGKGVRDSVRVALGDARVVIVAEGVGVNEGMINSVTAEIEVQLCAELD